MGVPGFFAWLRRKYPQIVEDSAKDNGRDEDAEDSTCDNLYIGESALKVILAMLLAVLGNTASQQ